MTDAELTACAMAAGRGDRAAAEQLIRATQPAVTRFLRSVIGEPDVDDLVQETFLRALRTLPDFAGRSSVRTWLFVIAKRVAADRIRLLTRRPRVAAVDNWVRTADAVQSRDNSRFEEAHAIAGLLAELPADRREAFVATQLMGLSYGEAAEALGCPIGTIRSRVARARTDLVAALSRSETQTRRTA